MNEATPPKRRTPADIANDILDTPIGRNVPESDEIPTFDMALRDAMVHATITARDQVDDVENHDGPEVVSRLGKDIQDYSHLLGAINKIARGKPANREDKMVLEDALLTLKKMTTQLEDAGGELQETAHSGVERNLRDTLTLVSGIDASRARDVDAKVVPKVKELARLLGVQLQKVPDGPGF